MPFELNDKDHRSALCDIDPDLNFYQEFNQATVKCNYYLETKFNDEMSEPNGTKYVLSLCHVNIRSARNKANLRVLIAATGLVILLKLDSNHRFFAHVTLKFDGWPRKIIRHVFYTTSSFNLCIISDPSGISNWRYSPETANLGQNRRFF